MKWSIAGATVGGLLTGAIALLRSKSPKIDVILGLVAGAAIGQVAFLTWNMLLDWFRSERQALAVDDEKTLSILLNQKLSSGKYKEVQCLYDTSTNKLNAATVYEADDMDEMLKAHHRDEELLILR